MDKLFKCVGYREASPDLRYIYDDIMATMKISFVPNIFKCQGNNVTLLKGNWAKVKYTMFRGCIPPFVKELIVFNISNKKSYLYCAKIHGHKANLLVREVYQNPSVNIIDRLEDVKVPEKYKIAIKIATKCGVDSQSIDQNDISELRAASFTNREIEELFSLVDLTLMLNTLANVAGIPIDEELLGLNISSSSIEAKNGNLSILPTKCA